MIKFISSFREVSVRHPSKKVTLFSLAFILLACQPTHIPTQIAVTATSIVAPTQLPTQTEPAPTATLLPTPTQTPIPLTMEATIWSSDPVIPILNYHRFTPNSRDKTSGMVRYLGDLKNDLKSFYDSGYTLISLDDLLSGNIRVPVGRRPLILTIDDAYFANQFSLNEQGGASEFSAVGTIYRFSEEHPDFGFEIAMFANFGDKHYANSFTGTWWYEAEGWEQALADTIAWGIEHHVYPYNHTFRHPHLDQVADEVIQPQLGFNDQKLREVLTLAGHPEYASLLSNYVALPYGRSPITDKGKQLLISYVDPEGDPVRAVFEAGYEYAPAFASVPFSAGFNPMHVPRMAAIPSVIKLITEKASTFPSAERCEFTVVMGFPNIELIVAAIEQQIASGQCPEGVYILDEGVFIARDGAVKSYKPGN